MSDNHKQFTIGIDIGATNTKCGIVDEAGLIMGRFHFKTNEYDTAAGFIDGLYDFLLPHIDALGHHNIKGIGVGAPNANYYDGTINYAANLRWEGVIPFADMAGRKFGLPVTITNDANAAAMGEMLYGSAKNMKDFIMITIGTGLGSGIVVNGRLMYGHDGFAGELGHTTIRPGGRRHWTTGIQGSLESYCSATGLIITARNLLKRSKEDSLLREYAPADIDASIINFCAEKGDPVAIETYRFTGQILGEALANFVMFSSPEAIILFGGIMKAGNLLLVPAKEHMELNLLHVFRNKVKLLCSLLPDADAAILGAAALIG